MEWTQSSIPKSASEKSLTSGSQSVQLAHQAWRVVVLIKLAYMIQCHLCSSAWVQQQCLVTNSVGATSHMQAFMLLCITTNHQTYAGAAVNSHSWKQLTCFIYTYHMKGVLCCEPCALCVLKMQTGSVRLNVEIIYVTVCIMISQADPIYHCAPLSCWLTSIVACCLCWFWRSLAI